MADNDDKREDGAGGKKTLTLKGAPNLGGRPGMARSSRSTVVVEKRTRVVVPQRGPAPSSGPSSGSGAPRPHSSQPQNSGRPPMRSNSNSNAPRVGGGLSSTEAEARQRALREAAARQADEAAQRRADDQRRAEEDARRQAIRDEASAKKNARRRKLPRLNVPPTLRRSPPSRRPRPRPLPPARRPKPAAALRRRLPPRARRVRVKIVARPTVVRAAAPTPAVRRSTIVVVARWPSPTSRRLRRPRPMAARRAPFRPPAIGRWSMRPSSRTPPRRRSPRYPGTSGPQGRRSRRLCAWPPDRHQCRL